MIKMVKQYEGSWMVFDRKGNTAEIHTTNDMFMGNYSKKYTVVYNGKRVGIMIDHFQTAKSVAYQYVKGEK